MRTLKIGKYNFYPSNDDNGIFIQKDDGEGMSVSVEKLEQLIDKFWQEEF